jgi:hypothetical protein
MDMQYENSLLTSTALAKTEVLKPLVSISTIGHGAKTGPLISHSRNLLGLLWYALALLQQ